MFTFLIIFVVLYATFYILEKKSVLWLDDDDFGKFLLTGLVTLVITVIVNTAYLVYNYDDIYIGNETVCKNLTGKIEGNYLVIDDHMDVGFSSEKDSLVITKDSVSYVKFVNETQIDSAYRNEDFLLINFYDQKCDKEIFYINEDFYKKNKDFFE